MIRMDGVGRYDDNRSRNFFSMIHPKLRNDARVWEGSERGSHGTGTC